jgi:hypothetical protein
MTLPHLRGRNILDGSRLNIRWLSHSMPGSQLEDTTRVFYGLLYRLGCGKFHRKSLAVTSSLSPYTSFLLPTMSSINLTGSTITDSTFNTVGRDQTNSKYCFFYQYNTYNYYYGTQPETGAIPQRDGVGVDRRYNTYYGTPEASQLETGAVPERDGVQYNTYNYYYRMPETSQPETGAIPERDKVGVGRQLIKYVLN